MITAHILALLAATLQVPAPPAAAGRPLPQADSGSRIRVTVDKPSKHFLIGTLVSADADSLRFTDSTGATAIPIGTVARIERSRGRRSNAGRGALIGGLIGGGAGLALGIAASADDSGWYEVGPGEIAVATGILGAAGAGLGALIGATSRKERWEPVILQNAMPTLR